jgi:hypothetical protein
MKNEPNRANFSNIQTEGSVGSKFRPRPETMSSQPETGSFCPVTPVACDTPSKRGLE